MEADLRTKRVTTSVDVSAPRAGRPKGRVNWILRQLKNAPDDLRIDVSFANARESSSALLGQAQSAPDTLLSTTDPKREPRSFRLARASKMGTKRGKEEGSFARETRTQATAFYREIVQDLRPWQQPAPRLPVAPSPSPVTASPEPPPFTDETKRDPGEGVGPPGAR